MVQDQIKDHTDPEISLTSLFLENPVHNYQMHWSFCCWNSIYFTNSCGLDSSLTILFFVLLQFDLFCGDFEPHIKVFMSHMLNCRFDEARYFWITSIHEKDVNNLHEVDLFVMINFHLSSFLTFLKDSSYLYTAHPLSKTPLMEFHYSKVSKCSFSGCLQQVTTSDDEEFSVAGNLLSYPFCFASFHVLLVCSMYNAEKSL